MRHGTPHAVARASLRDVKMGKRGAQALSRNPNWKGGRVLASNGYVLVKVPNHPDADVRGYMYEHRLVAERKLDRRLLPGEIVHHIDGDKTNNSEINLAVYMSIAHHRHEHGLKKDLRAPDEPNTKIACACGCGSFFARFDAQGRSRCFISGHNMRKVEHGG